MSLAHQLLKENAELREDRRDLKEDLKDLTAKIPAKESIVLSADDKKAYEAFKALELTPEQITSKVKRAAEADALEARMSITQVAETMSWKPTVLEKLPGVDKLKFEIREETVDDEKLKVAYVIEGKDAKKLADYAKDTWSDFLPALVAAPKEEDVEVTVTPRGVYTGAGKKSDKSKVVIDVSSVNDAAFKYPG